MAAALLLAGGPIALAGCGGSAGTGAGGPGARVLVVAAENVWGSLAAQIGGSRTEVVSIVSNPDTDPHAFEPQAGDARAVAQARYVIVNGAGYDTWAARLIDANPSSSRTVLTVADLAGRHGGDNPHMWYSPSIVHSVVDRITSDLARLDPADAASFDRQRAALVSTGLTAYDGLRARIRARYAGVPVGATESIVVDLAQDLGLRLQTPPDYMRAISEGDDPSAADTSTVDALVSSHGVDVLVFNRQNSTPGIQRLVDTATRVGIPVVPITETLDPSTARFQDWQDGQLQALAAALARATGR